MIYELRTYYAAPGKVEALHNRFRNLTLRIFERYNMEVVGFWTPQKRTDTSGDLIYLLRFESEEALRQAWARFSADPEWIQGRDETHKDGVLAIEVRSQILLPTDYSPLS